MDLSIATSAGLTQSEIAHVLGVSRVTVNHWINGKYSPHMYIAEHINRRLVLLYAVIENGLIPKHTTNRKKPRHEALAKALKTFAATREPAPVKGAT